MRDIPEIRDSIKNSRLDEYVKNVIREYLLDKEDLISKIIVAKILSVDVAYKYKLICGSNSLFEEDMIGIALCGSFAEGDNNVLAYKLVMDNILSPSKYLS